MNDVLSGFNILIVEDDIDLIENLKDVLFHYSPNRIHINSSVVGKKYGAIDYLLGCEWCLDVVFLDIRIPYSDEDYIENKRKIKKWQDIFDHLENLKKTQPELIDLGMNIPLEDELTRLESEQHNRICEDGGLRILELWGECKRPKEENPIIVGYTSLDGEEVEERFNTLLKRNGLDGKLFSKGDIPTLSIIEYIKDEVQENY